jgi:deoxycytidylate deaminase
MKEILTEDHNLIWITNQLYAIASVASCKRSKCGSVVVDKNLHIIGEGWNSKPCGEEGECFKDSLATTFKSDRTCCIHAEQRAIMDALKHNPEKVIGGSIFFLRLDENDKPKHSGQPYCTICSKMALDVGIKKFVLLHKEGWTAYDTKYYNELSFKFNQTPSV